MNKTSTELKRLQPLNPHSTICKPEVIKIVEKAEEVVEMSMKIELCHDLCVDSSLAANLAASSGVEAKLWMGVDQAAMYSAIITERYDLHWHSLFQENRRTEQVVNNVFDMRSVLDDEQRKATRGNQHKLGRVDYTNYKGRVYYAVRDLDRWLHNIVGKLPAKRAPH